MTYVLSRLPEYDLVIKMDDDLEISPSNLKRALLASRPWQATILSKTKKLKYDHCPLPHMCRRPPFTATRSLGFLPIGDPGVKMQNWR